MVAVRHGNPYFFLGVFDEGPELVGVHHVANCSCVLAYVVDHFFLPPFFMSPLSFAIFFCGIVEDCAIYADVQFAHGTSKVIVERLADQRLNVSIFVYVVIEGAHRCDFHLWLQPRQFMLLVLDFLTGLLSR